ncbi:protein mono-ADP-ribosyltransferase PARP14-like, partial [Mercenaria mercenaria]|uniref:protein mono-ADP-ribosyltransferase PARP14-like n=1 Tax=Mercenaria mercenaria TaxID=6596 RepID=UPI00234E3EA9
MNFDSVAPAFKVGPHELDLQKTVRECMEITEKRQLSSIAFPAIGTGTLGYPHEVVAAEMLSAIEKVSVKSHKVNDVRFIMFQTDHKAAQAFEDELKKRHGTCSKTDVFEKRRRPWFLRNFRLGKQMEQSNDAAISVKQTEQSNNVGQVQVTLVKGEISEQKVNVIVNTVANSLDLSCGSVSSALLKAAGPDLQGELNTKYANGIQSGEIAISSGKGLKCDHVFHCTLANWNAADTNTSKHVLRSAITTCMHEAEKLRHSSMALPAIGTGNLGFPCDVVATEMFNAVSTFPAMCLKDIRVVIFPTHTQTVQAFEEEFLKWTSQIDFGNVFGANDTQLEHTLALASPSPALHAS